jgi:uncharacterized protein YndB with AHSA1/START domain
LAPAAHIGTAVGDPYVIVFDPDTDPEGANHGTKGGEIIALEPDRHLAFTWTFPPFGPEFNTKPFPTWVEITVGAFAGDGQRTLLHFAHRGFPEDPSWDRVLEVFRDGNWPLVLNRLLVYCRDGVSPAWGQEDGDHLDRLLLKTATVAAPPAEVWNAWTTKEGLEGFLCPQATVELRPGGPYEILFLLDAPEGQRGCEGCQIVAFEPEEWLSFTWNSPPSLPEVRELKTNVVVELSEVEAGAATKVRLLAIGWGSGESWVASHQYFDKAWSAVLNSLATHFDPDNS